MGKRLDRTDLAIKMLHLVVMNERGCWIWPGTHSVAGYGKIRANRKQYYAHRMSYELFVGPIPKGHELHHFYCATKDCCNPNHLRPLTPKEHALMPDSAPGLEARKTHCKAGHVFDTRNTLHVQGSRRCRACSNVRKRKYLADRKQSIGS